MPVTDSLIALGVGVGAFLLVRLVLDMRNELRRRRALWKWPDHDPDTGQPRRTR
jgi:hypothetical protein